MSFLREAATKTSGDNYGRVGISTLPYCLPCFLLFPTFSDFIKIFADEIFFEGI